MRKIPFLFCVLLISAGVLYSQDAESIVRSSRERIAADTVFHQSVMVISSRDGTVTERFFEQYSKPSSEGSRSLIIFQRPASVADTCFLMVEDRAGICEQQIFLPSLGQVRPISPSDGFRPFMGTDFSYDDMSLSFRKASLDRHRVLREETYEGSPCYVIESLPKDSSYQYSKMVSWIDKSSFANRKTEFYDKKGALAKRYELLEMQDVQGRLSPTAVKLTTVGTNTSTTISVEKLRYNDPIPDRMFTAEFLSSRRNR